MPFFLRGDEVTIRGTVVSDCKGGDLVHLRIAGADHFIPGGEVSLASGRFEPGDVITADEFADGNPGPCMVLGSSGDDVWVRWPDGHTSVVERIDIAGRADPGAFQAAVTAAQAEG